MKMTVLEMRITHTQVEESPGPEGLILQQFNYLYSLSVDEYTELSFMRGIWSSAVDGDIHKVKLLLRQNRELANERDSSGYTALHYAARNGHTDICRELINAGAIVNIQTTSGGVTPLHRACYKGYKDIVRLLLSEGADPQLADNDGMTPLHKACENGHIEVIKILHNSLPSTAVQQTNKRGETPLQILYRNSQITENLKAEIKLLFN